MFTHDLLCASSQNCFLYFATSSSERPSGVNLWFFSFTPNTIVPPLVLAKAEKERQNSTFGKPPAVTYIPLLNSPSVGVLDVFGLLCSYMLGFKC